MATAYGSSSEPDSAAVSFMGSAWGAKFLSITTIKLNERNYHSWAKSIQVYLLAQGQATYLTDDPPDSKDPLTNLGRKRMLIFVSSYGILKSLQLVVVGLFRYDQIGVGSE